MYHVSKSFTFEASHQLPNHDGKCKRLHGHSWKAEVTVSGKKLEKSGPKEGMLLDFGVLGEAIEILREQYLDHHHLNDTIPAAYSHPPTSENIARFIADYLLSMSFEIKSVTVHETCTCAATYIP
jgi:6-pyruvoyltetrahydropterin/6-carboxytetrahydropterin synthase